MSAFALPGGGAVRLSAPSAAAALEAVETRLSEGKGFALHTLNLDHLVKLRRSDAFREAYRDAEIVTADGNPVVWLARLQGERVRLAPGSELVEPLCALAARRGWPVALLGSTPAALAATAEQLCARHPGLRIATSISPAFGFDPQGSEAEETARAVAASGARLCLIALGAPKQEIFARRARALAPACGFVAVGAGLDFIAGTQIRAPLWVRRLALEWLWRALGAPTRLGARYAACMAILPGLVARALASRATRGRSIDGGPT